MESGKLIRCPKCKKPLFKLKDGSIVIQRNSRGEDFPLKIKCHFNGEGSIEISCDKCNFLAFKDIALGDKAIIIGGEVIHNDKID